MADPGSQLDLGLAGMRTAFIRLQEASDLDNDLLGTSVALVEYSVWVAALTETVRDRTRPAKLKQMPTDHVLDGFRWARDRGAHQLVAPTHAPVANQLLSSRRGGFSWLPRQLIEVKTRRRPHLELAYDEALARRPVIATAELARQVLEQAVTQWTSGGRQA